VESIILSWLIPYKGYMAFFFLSFLTYMMYSYIYHLYSSEKKGTRDYEQYGKLALDDACGTPPLEKRETKKNS